MPPESDQMPDVVAGFPEEWEKFGERNRRFLETFPALQGLLKKTFRPTEAGSADRVIWTLAGCGKTTLEGHSVLG